MSLSYSKSSRRAFELHLAHSKLTEEQSKSAPSALGHSKDTWALKEHSKGTEKALGNLWYLRNWTLEVPWHSQDTCALTHSKHLGT